MCLSPWYRAHFHYIHWWKVPNSCPINPRERNMVATCYLFKHRMCPFQWWFGGPLSILPTRLIRLSNIEGLLSALGRATRCQMVQAVGSSFSVSFCNSSLHVHAFEPFCFPSTLTPKLISASLVAFQHRPVLWAPTAYLYIPLTTPDTSIWPHPNMSKTGSQSPQP